MRASIIIRTYNEGEHLPLLLQKISEQHCSVSPETIIVDSGSTDNTLAVANSFETKVVNIEKNEFTFGKSLNFGCDSASGDYLIFISGHCIPQNNDWLEQLIQPLQDQEIVYSYGRQVGNQTSRFSECQIFRKYFPETSSVPQDGFFCNNANAALKKEIWARHPFNEALTGLEDMELA
ncbi:MAG: glycosyltransferase family 2 protein, partial [Candidatus Electrothrix sp. AR4]|nr:glycosyltransferase family 2 protein [Candidatus Electrothrix sp. AR4]